MVTIGIFGYLILIGIHIAIGFLFAAVIFRYVYSKKLKELDEGWSKIATQVNEDWYGKLLNINNYWGEQHKLLNDRWAIAWETNMKKFQAERLGLIQKIADGEN